MTSVLLLVAVLALAFFNGANDVSKGVATLVGSGVTRTRTAVAWGSAWTMAGAIAAAFVAQGLVRIFTGRGLISPEPGDSGFLIAVTGGALAWVGFATRAGLPVSTTHAITGSLVGVGLVAVGVSGLQWQLLLERFALPLVLSPLLALALMFVCFPMVSLAVARLQRFCVCLDQAAAAPLASAPAMTLETTTALRVDEARHCDRSPATVWRLNPVDGLHWLSAGATSFARGLNDAPKILALGLAAAASLGAAPTQAFVLVALSMGLGSVIGGIRVTQTLARKVTVMSPSEGLAANLVTSLLVLFASRLALPVSTTHVSSGAIIGLGLRRDARHLHWRTVRDFLLAWLITLPVAGLFGVVVYGLERAWR